MTPSGWAAASVEELFDIQLGKMLNKEAAATTPSFPYLGNREVQWGQLDLSDLRRMHFSEEERQKFSLRNGDLLVCEGGEVGRAALWRGGFECYFQKAIHRLRPRNGRALSAYMLHFMRFAATTGLLADFTSQSSIAHLTREKLAKVQLLLPPLGEQRKIAAILSSVDEAIEATQAVIDQLHVVKKAMMAELLTRGLPGRHTRFKQTEIGEVPEEWEVTTIGELASFKGGNGFRPPDWSTSGLPIIRIQNLNGSKDFNYYALEPEPDWIVEPGELLFAWAGSRGASFGPCIWPGPRGVLNQHIHRIHPGERVLKPYLYFVLRLVTEAVEKKAHGFKDTLVHLKKSELTGWPIAVPSIEDQKKLLAVLVSIDDRLHAEVEHLDSLCRAKIALMSVLLTGEVRVKPDEEAA